MGESMRIKEGKKTRGKSLWIFSAFLIFGIGVHTVFGAGTKTAMAALNYQLSKEEKAEREELDYWEGENPFLNSDAWTDKYTAYIYKKTSNISVAEYKGFTIILDEKKKQAAAFIFTQFPGKEHITYRKSMSISIPDKVSGIPVVKIYYDYARNDDGIIKQLKIPRYVREVEITHGGIKQITVSKNNKVLKEKKGILYKKVKYHDKNTWALYRCYRMKFDKKHRYYIPSGVKVIEPYAFANSWARGAQYSDSKVVFPKTLEKIGHDAFIKVGTHFAGWNFYIPQNVKNIGADAFWGNKKVTFAPETKISKLTLSGTTMKTLKIPKGVTILGSVGSFCLQKIILPDSLKRIGRKAFYESFALKRVNLPKSVTHIGYQAFGDCFHLKNVKLREGLKSIDSYAFYNTPLKSITIPKSVTNLKKNSFVQYDKKSISHIDNQGKIFYHHGTKQLLIHVKKGSYAHKFAKKYHLRFRVY